MDDDPSEHDLPRKQLTEQELRDEEFAKLLCAPQSTASNLAPAKKARNLRHALLGTSLIVCAGWFVCSLIPDDAHDHYVPVPYGAYAPHEPIGEPSGESERLAEAEVMLRVQVYDDTQSRPLHDKCEIWFRGHGSWWLKPETKFGTIARNIGLRKVDQKDSIVLYPDGRDGQEILIPFTMTNAMNPKGSVRDSIFITIGDDDVEIVGLPLKAATGKITMRIERGK